eukprot:CAMPEP_0197832416 /NCGR_PEP_ID=MMETSP1437-20131217/14667_1 /TAXON_ID=49252 ORGANISM="Eucampia antarctica, Strain CCMP1452" /NCGR_SAMPLE_ID=MMETSP1437 /ASSEMBLY_ACC=CAM_ASM_001096 /LENGTH=293 /DNA_ID=CAMNT_0043435791 /DNA_START=121 /DNA_END=1002 /DNA_ORIENTATION=+
MSISAMSTTATAAVSSVVGRVAVVTGGNKGIGYHIALQLASSGLFEHVILGCRNAALGADAVTRIQKELQSKTKGRTNVDCWPLIIGDKVSHESFCASMEDRFGKMDLLVNNAGIAYKNADPTPFNIQCQPTLDINFRGTVDFTETMLPLLRRGQDARMVNVASMAGGLRQLQSNQFKDKFSSDALTMSELRQLVDQFQSNVMDGTHIENGWGSSNYGMSKLALIAATKVWARNEMNHTVKVNCCCPGYCDTDMTSHKGPRHPSEGAKNAILPATMQNCPTGQYFSNYEISQW